MGTHLAGDSAQTGLNADRMGTVSILNPNGRASMVLVCEHASNFIPRIYADLGLDTAVLQSHIAGVRAF